MRCSAVASLLAYFFSRRQARSRFYRALLAGISNALHSRIAALLRERYYRQSEMFFSRPIVRAVALTTVVAAVKYGRGDGLVHTQASGRHDIVTFVEDPTTAGLSGGIAHFGFRLVDPGDIDRAIAEVEQAGGRLLRRGEFAPGLPYAYVADPDGYEIEIWFE